MLSRIIGFVFLAFCFVQAVGVMVDSDGIVMDSQYVEPLTPRYYHLRSPLIQEIESSILQDVLISLLPERSLYLADDFLSLSRERVLDQHFDSGFLNWLFLSLSGKDAYGKQAKNGDGEKKDTDSDSSSSSSDSESEHSPDEAEPPADGGDNGKDDAGRGGKPPQRPEDKKLKVNEVVEKSTNEWVMISVNGKEFRVRRKEYEKNQCPVCQQILQDAVPLCQIHRTCESCSSDYRKSPRGKLNICAQCERYLKKLNEDTIEIVRETVQLDINGMEVHCETCSWDGAFCDAGSHECEMAIVTCPHAGCGQQLIESEVEQHVTECPWRPQTVTVTLPQWLAETLSHHAISEEGETETSELLQELSLAMSSHHKGVFFENAGCQTEVLTSEAECQIEAEIVETECQTLENEITGMHYRECEYYPEKCPCCDVEHPRGQMDNHLSSCPKLILKCKKCDEEVQREAMAAHVGSTCPQHVIQCSHCAHRCVRAKMASHEFGCLTAPRTCHQCKETYMPENEIEHLELCRGNHGPCIRCGYKEHSGRCEGGSKPLYSEVGETQHIGCGFYRCQENLARFFWVINEKIFNELWCRNLHGITAGPTHNYRGYTYQLILRVQDSELHMRLLITGEKYGAPKQCKVYVMEKTYECHTSIETEFIQDKEHFLLDCNLGKFGDEVCGVSDGSKYSSDHLILMIDITCVQ